MTRGRTIFIFASFLTVSLVVGGSMWASTAGRQDDDGRDSLYKYLAVFSEVLGLIDRAYVDETQVEILMAGAFEGAADALDPFSLYVPSRAVSGYSAAREIGVSRGGMLVLKERGVAYAVAVESGSPAAGAGIEAGDILTLLQGESTRPMPLYRIHTILAGPVGSKIEIELIHRGNKEDVSFELSEYERPGVTLETHKGIAVLKIGAFLQSTPDDVALSLRSLADPAAGLGEPAEKDKLLIDLRGIAGGAEEAAYRIAGLFAQGDLGALKSREQVVENFAADATPSWQGRLAVLLDRASQGPAEVLATVLRQRAGATLVGMPSFGLAGRQSLVRLSNGDRFQITDSFFTGPDQEPIRGALEPDVAVRPSYDLDVDALEDAILERGLTLLIEDEVVEEKQAA